MPFIHIRIAGRQLSGQQIRELQDGTTRLIASVMRKNADLTSVLVEPVALSGWSIGGAVAQAAAAHVEINVTAGTNTGAEKARMIAQQAALLKEVLGEALPVATYVIIREVPADAWGYDGLTQQQRGKARLAA
jgi:4-oxalocrotonate tautomerase